jgi:hypothetical protein
MWRAAYLVDGPSYLLFRVRRSIHHAAPRGTNGVTIDRSDAHARHNANSGYFSLPDAQRFASLKAGNFPRLGVPVSAAQVAAQHEPA